LQTIQFIKGYVTKVTKYKTSGEKPKDYTCFSLATNIYNFKERDKNDYPTREGTIWTNYIYWGDVNLKVGMPVVVESHLTLSKSKEISYNMVADSISLDLTNKNAKEYIK